MNYHDLHDSVHSLPAIVWITDEAGQATFINDAWIAFTGRGLEEELGVGWMTSIHAEDRLGMVERREAAMASRQEFTTEYRARRHDGVYRWMLDRGTPRYSEGGVFLGYTGAVVDITGHRELEFALRDSQERLNASLAASRTGTFQWSIAEDRLEWDEHLYSLFGLDDDGSVTTALDFVRHVHEDDRYIVESGLERIKRDGLDFIHEFRVMWPDGTVRWLSQRSAVTLDDNGTAESMTGACTDITHRKRAELALQSAKEALEESNDAKDRFLAALSHELRTPLSPVAIVLDTLLSDVTLAEETRSMLSIAQRNIAVQARLIDDILDLTRISAGKLHFERKTLRVHQVIHHALDICSSDVEAKELRVALELNATDDRIVGDAARLQQVFWNVLCNAAKFTPDFGTITVRSSSNERELIVEVQDSGIGIEPDQQRRIFDIYAQVPAARRQGLGLGLSISRSIVDAHLGTITARSAGIGHGTTIRITLPLESSLKPTDAESSDKPQILLVEDDPILLEALRMWLASNGYDVHVAGSGAEAEAVVESTRIDLLVCDIRLPDIDGDKLLRRVRESMPLRAIAISGFGLSSDVQHSLGAGFDTHLVKPVDLNHLTSEIERLLHPSKS